MLKPILLASAMAAALLSQSANAYDPDGFHECILEHVKSDMGKASLLAVREACAYQNDTTIMGEEKPPTIADDSYMREFKNEHASEIRESGSCNYPLSINSCIVSAIRDEWYPSREIEEVREWLYRSRAEHGPIPPKEN